MSLQPRRRPRALAIVAAVLGVSAAGLLAAPAPTVAAGSPCTSEAPTGGVNGLGQTRCDDVDPPQTSLVGATPTANREGYLRQTQVAISFAGAYDDGDTDAITYECRLYDTTTPPPWVACTSPVSYPDLHDTGATPYTFEVRAIDSADQGLVATSAPDAFGSGATTDVPDVDPTPAAASFSVDTTVPNTFVFDAPYDDVTPDHPMTTQPEVTLDLESTEPGVAYTCRLGRRTVPCQDGPTTFTGLRPGNQAITAVVRDRAGNVDATPALTRLSVPRDLEAAAGRGWSTVSDASGAAFGGDYLQSATPGATLVVRAHAVRDLRVLAPSGPLLGVVEMQVGGPHHTWTRLSQRAATSSTAGVVFQSFVGGAYTGPITFRVLRASAARPAALDAVLLH